ncbi:MAG: protease pro-enzyme activation domain-containing protein [Conexivisphaerales archaeon]
MRRGIYVVLLILLASSLGIYAVPAAASNVVTAPSISGFKFQGQLSSSAMIPVTVLIPLRNSQLLYSMLQSVSTPGSSSYGHFITQAQAQKLFYPVAQYENVMNYLKSKGFIIYSEALDSAIVAYGTPSMISKYLGLTVDLYSNGSISYYAAVGTSKLSGTSIYSSNITAFIIRPMAIVNTALSSQPNMTSPITGVPATQLRSVYGASGLLSKGYNGSGYTIGILDFYGDPYIAGQLQKFDSEYGIPNPPSFKTVAIGPYNPNLGIFEGWADEISLDVEISHTMAPGANITLYAANNALPLAPVIAQIVKLHAVNTLSQSFSIPESYIPTLGASGIMANVIMADQYYALGSLEGITFIASTGDAGGSGYSSGPEGTVGYPSTSPYVTAAGGTTVYMSGNSSYQTAWSNYGFVPFLVNYGGSTGGVSVLEPKPWYQDGLQSPKGYPDGRMVPDVSLDASVYPGTYIVFPGNVTYITGGTSEASPTLAGLLTLVMQYLGRPLGLINPALYKLGASAFTSITYGYNIPWVASSGYNLVTGLGSVNAQKLGEELNSTKSMSALNVTVYAYNSSMMPPANEEFYQGQQVYILAKVTLNGKPVTNGTFVGQLQALQGTEAVPMSFNSTIGLWQGNVTVPQNYDGIAYANVNGSYSGISGDGFTQAFLGYVVQALSPEIIYPESSEFGIPVIANITDLSGAPAQAGTFSFVPQFYSILNNTYTPSSPLTLSFAFPGLWEGMLVGTYPNGPVTLQFTGAYGYVEFMNGVDLQPMFILPQTEVEPGSVGPGQYIFVQGTPLPPLNVPFAISGQTGLPVYDNIIIGSNITASLVNQEGKVVSSVNIPFSETLGIYYGYIRVPENATPGLYTVLLNSNYSSITLGASIPGSFFGQVYVAPGYSVPSIRVVSQAYEGQNLNIIANISYQNGTEVRYGMYTAAIYPSSLQSGYGEYASYGVPLHYSQSANLWEGSVALSSPYTPFQYNISTGTVEVGNQGYSGPYDIFVSGISADGVPTSAVLAAQQPFYVNPILLIQGKSVINPEQTSQVAFMNDNITSAQLANDVLLGSNTITGNTSISYSTVNGTLYIKGSNAVIRSTSGNSIVAFDSNITLIDSGFKSVTLTGSHIALISSEITSISPALPTISIISPSSTVSYSSTIPFNVSVMGSDISSVNIYVDGTLVKSYPSGGMMGFSLSASSYPDGIHTVIVKAFQSDGLQSQASESFSTDYQLASVGAQLTNLAYIAIAIAAIGIIIAALALIVYFRKSH